jgi:DNA replicative helicase MCM subunit Mcm2 (Cdc46/Mcm family)
MVEREDSKEAKRVLFTVLQRDHNMMMVWDPSMAKSPVLGIIVNIAYIYGTIGCRPSGLGLIAVVASWLSRI